MQVTLIVENRSITLPDIDILECQAGSGTLTFTTTDPVDLSKELDGAFDYLRLQVSIIQNSEGAVRCYGPDLQNLTTLCVQ